VIPTKLLLYLGGAIIALIGVMLVSDRLYKAGVGAGRAEIQVQWDKDKAAIQKTADAALAAATKEKEDALETNRVIHDQYEAQLANTSANAADVLKRLRSAEGILAASRGDLSKTNSGQGSSATGSTGSADQLGTLVGLTADLHSDCTKNADQLDALIKELKPQL
jgi:type II secretory pathway component GspD/PulD (secretin)